MRLAMLITAAALLLGTVSKDVRGPLINRGWTFAEESVRLDVGEDFFKVSAEYVFTAGSDSEPLALLLPLAQDETLGEPILLEAGITCGTVARPLPVIMGQDGWRFVLNSPGPTKCTITLSYYQSMNGGRAVYVLRSAREWGRPLDRAVLEVSIEEGRACVIRPALEALGVTEGVQLFRASFEDWVPREDLVVELPED